MSSVCYNPFIYCWLNETFRRKTDSFLGVFVSFKNYFQRIKSIVCCANRLEQFENGNISDTINTTDEIRELDKRHQTNANGAECTQILITQDMATNVSQTGSE